MASNKLVVPFLPFPEGSFPSQTLPAEEAAEEDAKFPRLIDTVKLLERLKSLQKGEFGDICVPDMMVTVLHNYDKKVLKAFLDPKHEIVTFYLCDHGKEFVDFFIKKQGKVISERRI